MDNLKSIHLLKTHVIHCNECKIRIFADSYNKQEKYFPLHLYYNKSQEHFFYCGICKKNIKTQLEGSV